MDINILQMLEGAKKAEGITVIIDVFRAFSVEAYMFFMGAEKIIPIGDVNDAYKMKEDNPDVILAGERGGAIMPGFDTGNAPSLLDKINFKGKTVVHTTSAGTQGIANAKNADEILGASLVNARAVARYIKERGYKKVSLVCMGLEAKCETQEDTLCAEYIKALLEGENPDITREIEDLKNTSGAKFFDESQRNVFPEEDFYMCTQLNKFDFVMKYDKKTGIMNKYEW